jgi:arylsulfatase A-like enzyme
VRPTGLTVARHLAFGWLTGVALGVVGGIAETIALQLETAVRLAWVVGADGLLGGVWGLIAAGLLLPWRRRGFAVAGSAVLGLVAFPLVAAALGLFVNRVLLSGVHFLSGASLAADAVAVIVAAIACAGLVAVTRRRLEGRDAPRAGVPAAAIGAAALVAAVTLPHLGVGRPASSTDLPTLVLVSIDTLRPDRLSGGGEPRGTSPELDRLVREGVLFPEAIAASPGSAASHAALLTSRYPVSNGVWSNFSVMDPSVTTLAELLRDEGYRTGGFVTNTFLGRRFRFDQGFDAYVESGMVERLEEASPSVLFRSLALVQIADRIRVRLQPGYDPSFETALAWIRESDRPTFWFVHLMDVHSPYVPPHPYGPRFGAEAGGRATGPLGRKRNRFGWRPSEEAYLAEIRFADTKIGRLRRLLSELDRLDDAVIVLTSDHGENLVDHEPNFSHGVTLFDSTLRILAAIRWPGRVPAGTLEPRVIENVDLLPTLATLLDWVPSDDWEGRDLFDPSTGDRTITFSQLNRDFAARSAEWKFVLKETGEREGYELVTDPGETVNRGTAAEEVTRIEDALATWLAEHATELYRDRSSVIDPDELSPETLEKLRALGYLD